MPQFTANRQFTDQISQLITEQFTASDNLQTMNYGTIYSKHGK